jgi:hypothetical protein
MFSLTISLFFGMSTSSKSFFPIEITERLG